MKDRYYKVVIDSYAGGGYPDGIYAEVTLLECVYATPDGTDAICESRIKLVRKDIHDSQLKEKDRRIEELEARNKEAYTLLLNSSPSGDLCPGQIFNWQDRRKAFLWPDKKEARGND